MANYPVPTGNFTTTGQVRVGKDGTSVDTPFFSLECRITKTSAEAKHAFPVDLPANAAVEHVHIHPFGASTIATGTHVGIGGTSDPDEFVLATENDIDAVGENVTYVATAVSPSASAKTLYLHAANSSGGAAGTVYGDWGIRVTGRVIQPIATS